MEMQNRWFAAIKGLQENVFLPLSGKCCDPENNNRRAKLTRLEKR
jgi:hypothetical protein